MAIMSHLHLFGNLDDDLLRRRRFYRNPSERTSEPRDLYQYEDQEGVIDQHRYQQVRGTSWTHGRRQFRAKDLFGIAALALRRRARGRWAAEPIRYRRCLCGVRRGWRTEPVSRLLVIVMVVPPDPSLLGGRCSGGRRSTTIVPHGVVVEQGVFRDTFVVEDGTPLPQQGDECTVLHTVLGHQLRSVPVEIIVGLVILLSTPTRPDLERPSTGMRSEIGSGRSPPGHHAVRRPVGLVPADREVELALITKSTDQLRGPQIGERGAVGPTMSEMTLLSQKVITKVIKTKSLAKLFPDNQV